MKQSLFAFLFLIGYALSAQELPVAREIERAYQKGTRSKNGAPGANYWQNGASYNMDIRFDPETRKVSGTVLIDYRNESPDTLRQILFKLYPNLYKKGTPKASAISPDDLTEGVVIDSFFANGNRLAEERWQVQGTNMNLRGQRVAPKSSIRFKIVYHYTLNKGSHIRTGEVEPGAHFVAYFFPRVAVYDDIDGWNRYPYLGSQEFYNDFSNFDVRITLPRNFLVWATGDLQNATEVLQQPYLGRLQLAERSDSIINIIDTTDLGKRITADKDFLSWHYKASNVVDFTFATSDHYIWQSSSLVVDPKTSRRTRVDAVFNPVHHDYFWVAPDARKTVEVMSYVFPKWPFPYSHITVFDGLDQMEYPMMVNDNPVETRMESVTLTDHEIFHTMFPFYMGTNETKYAWMDEGWATIGEWLISPLIDSTIVDDYGVLPTEIHLGTEADLPIMTLSAESGNAYFTNAYPEPAMGYLFVRDYLGDSLFTKALHHYIRLWNGKHPVPHDFFNSMNAGAGKNMNWYWKRWFFEGGKADLGIASVTPKLNAYRITIKSNGTKPVPIDLQITFTDKTTLSLHRSIGVWEKGNASVQIDVPTHKKIEKITLGSIWVPDTDKRDNVWTAR